MKCKEFEWISDFTWVSHDFQWFDCFTSYVPLISWLRLTPGPNGELVWGSGKSPGSSPVDVGALRFILDSAFATLAELSNLLLNAAEGWQTSHLAIRQGLELLFLDLLSLAGPERSLHVGL